MQEEVLTLKREQGFKWTQGTLWYEDALVCYTLEPPSLGGIVSERDIERNKAILKAFGTPIAIPAGRYRVRMGTSERFKTRRWYGLSGGRIPHVENVPGFAGIEFHPGNAVKDTSGCILPGMSFKSGWLDRSTDAYLRVCDIVRLYPQGIYMDVIDI